MIRAAEPQFLSNSIPLAKVVISLNKGLIYAAYLIPAFCLQEPMEAKGQHFYSLSFSGADGVTVISLPPPSFLPLSFGSSIAPWGSEGWGSWRPTHSSRSTAAPEMKWGFQRPSAVPGSRRAGRQDWECRLSQNKRQAALQEVSSRCSESVSFASVSMRSSLEAFQWIFQPVSNFVKETLKRLSGG